jgi:tight adherence protein B
MTVLAALSVGVFCAAVGGLITGVIPRTRSAATPRRRAQTGHRQLWLQQAGVEITPGQFWLFVVGAGVVTFCALVIVTGTPLVAVVPAVGAASIPGAAIGRRRSARLRDVQASWPDGVRDLLASISAGRSMTQALNALAATGPAPLRLAFARFPVLAPMIGTVPALEIVKEELADPTSDRVIEVLILAHERGGDIVRDILEDLVVATTKDVKVLDEIETDGLEMKINARAVVILPWLVLLALTLRAGPFRDFYRSPAGLLVVVIGAGLSVVGAFAIGRLGRWRGEERVFGGGAAVAPRAPS